MVDLSRSLCSKIVDGPDNESIGQLTNLLNKNRSLNHDEIFERCGKYLSGIKLENCLFILIENGEKDLIEKYLRCIDDIPEKTIYSRFKFFIEIHRYSLGKTL